MKDEKELTHIDLFSGIGGFTLAAEWAGFKTVVFCEKEEFCQKILQKRFGAVITDSKSMGRRNGIAKNKRKESRKINSFSDQTPLLIPEIRDFDGTKYRGATLLTGGFPCQPFSVAGPRRGKEDDRYLWPEMLRVIGEAKPRWILAENVPGIFRMALDTVLADLEGEGYTTGTFIIPACGLNAPHRRNRIWIVANARKQERNRLSGIGGKKMAKIGNKNQNAPDPKCLGWQERAGKRIEHEKQVPEGQDIGDNNSERVDSNPECLRLECAGSEKGMGKKGETSGKKRRESSSSFEINGISRTESSRTSWEQNWYEIAARFCRVDDGVSDRVHRLKALGNAIVPQVAYEILKNIAWIENELA